MTFRVWFDRTAIAAMSFIALYIGSQIKNLNASVVQLDKSVAVLTEKVMAMDTRVTKLE
jgi:hypothetical protein